MRQIEAMHGASLAEPCPVAMSLVVCLDEVEQLCPDSAELVRAAAERLGLYCDIVGRAHPFPPASHGALVRYLEHILPDIEASCVDAAGLVRHAVGHLRQGFRGPEQGVLFAS